MKKFFIKHGLRFQNMLNHSLFLQNVLKLGGGTALAQMIPILATPIITRFYTPSDMGLLGIFMAFIGIAGVGVSLRYDMAIATVKEYREAVTLLTSSLFIAIPASISAGLIFLCFIKYNVLSYHILPTWSALVAVFLLLFTGIFMSLRFWFVRQEEYNIIGRALVSQGAGRAAIPIIFGFLQTGWIGLLLGELAGRLLGINRMLRVAWPVLKDSIRTLKHDNIIAILSRNWKYPAILLPSSLIDASAVLIPLPVISSLFGQQAAGQFFLVQRISSLPAGLIAASVADVFHPAVAKLHWNESDQIRKMLLRVIKSLTVTSCLIYIPVAVVSPFVFGFVFGNEWHAAGICMTIIAPFSIVALIVSPLSRLLVVAEKIELKLYFDVFSLVVPVLGMIIMHHIGYGFFSCLAAFAFLNIVANAIYFGLIWHVSGHSMAPNQNL